MAIEGFGEITSTVYIAKRLYDMGKYKLVKNSFFDTLAYDFYYENMYSLIENLFEQHHCRYSEYRNMEIHVLSDPVIADFYTLAGEYGRRSGVSDTENPYIRAAELQVHNQLSFSYCLDWMLMGHTEPSRTSKSRLGIFIYQDDYVDAGLLAYRLIDLYEWFSGQCETLKNLLAEEAMAA